MFLNFGFYIQPLRITFIESLYIQSSINLLHVVQPLLHLSSTAQ